MYQTSSRTWSLADTQPQAAIDLVQGTLCAHKPWLRLPVSLFLTRTSATLARAGSQDWVGIATVRAWMRCAFLRDRLLVLLPPLPGRKGRPRTCGSCEGRFGAEARARTQRRSVALMRHMKITRSTSTGRGAASPWCRGSARSASWSARCTAPGPPGRPGRSGARTLQASKAHKHASKPCKRHRDAP